MVSPVNLHLESVVASMPALHSLLHGEVLGSAARQPFARSQLFGVPGEEYICSVTGGGANHSPPEDRIPGSFTSWSLST